MGQFADNLKAQLATSNTEPAPMANAEAAAALATAPATPVGAVGSPPPPMPTAAKPISGFSLMFKMLWNGMMHFFTGRSRG
jgi:hypothetical protein